VAATPAAPVPPTAPSSFAPPATEPVEPPAAEPAAFAPPAAEPHTARTEREPYAPPGYSFASSELPSSKTPVIATEESFFSGPGVWIGEPPRAEERRSTLKTWATRVGSVLAGLIVAMVFVVSIGPKFLPYQMFFVRSGSMHPTFNTGDMVVLTKVDASDLKEGDVITFDRPDKPGTLVTHRIVGIKTDEQGRSFQTKGDANDANDPWSVPASGTGWKYSFNIPKLGFVFGYLGTPQARLALLAIPALLLGILSIIDIWKPQPKARGRR
jgi:signal peptidase